MELSSADIFAYIKCWTLVKIFKYLIQLNTSKCPFANRRHGEEGETKWDINLNKLAQSLIKSHCCTKLYNSFCSVLLHYIAMDGGGPHWIRRGEWRIFEEQLCIIRRNSLVLGSDCFLMILCSRVIVSQITFQQLSQVKYRVPESSYC